MTKTNTNIKRFKGAHYETMFHEIASNAYDYTKTYCTGNGKVYCLSKDGVEISVYYAGMRIALINKEKEIVEHLPKGSFVGTIYYILNSLKYTFDHYTIKEVTCFTIEEAQHSLAMHTDRDFSPNIFTMCSLEYLLDTFEHMSIDTKELTKVSEVVKKFKDKKEKEAEKRRKAEEERLAKKNKEIEELIPFFTKYFNKFNDTFEKLRHYRNTYRLKLEDIPEEYKQHFVECTWYNNNKDEKDWTYEPHYSAIYDYQHCLGIRMIDRYAYRNGDVDLPDGIKLVGHTLLTTQGCEVDILSQDFMLLFKALMHRIKKKEDCSEFYGDAVGDYNLREVNYDEGFIRVGCHSFLLEDILKLEKDIKNAYNLHQS